MKQTWIRNYDSNGEPTFVDGKPEFVLKENRVNEPKFSVMTMKKTDKIFHHEAGKGSRRR